MLHQCSRYSSPWIPPLNQSPMFRRQRLTCIRNPEVFRSLRILGSSRSMNSPLIQTSSFLPQTGAPLRLYGALFLVCILLVILFGGIFYSLSDRTTSEGKPKFLRDFFWDAWCCLFSTDFHLFQTWGQRIFGCLLAFFGFLIFNYLSDNIFETTKGGIQKYFQKTRSQVIGGDHIIICGVNDHLRSILKQLNKRHELAVGLHNAKLRKQRIVIMSSLQEADLKQFIEKQSKGLQNIDILIISCRNLQGKSLKSAGAAKAQSIIFLSSFGDRDEVDLHVLLSIADLQSIPGVTSIPIVVGVANSQTSKVLQSSLSLQIKVVENVASKILVRCSRQKALIKVYRHLLDYRRNVFNLCSVPDLVGRTYKQLRQGFEGAIVCGLYRDGKVELHSNDDQIIRQTDKVLLIAPGNTGKIKMQLAFPDAEQDKLTTQNLSVLKPSVRRKECILLLGWRQDMTEMIKEYNMCLGPGSVLIVLSDVSIDERKRDITLVGLTKMKFRVSHLLGNPCNENSLANAIIHARSSMNGDKNTPFSIIVMYDREWSIKDSFKFDNRRASSMLPIKTICEELGVKVDNIVAEIFDYKLGKKLNALKGFPTYIAVEEVLSLLTVQVASNPELNEVWRDILHADKYEIVLKDIGLYMDSNENMSFFELTERAAMTKEVLIGYRKNDEMVINPISKKKPLNLATGDFVIVICPVR